MQSETGLNVTKTLTAKQFYQRNVFYLSETSFEHYFKFIYYL